MLLSLYDHVQAIREVLTSYLLSNFLNSNSDHSIMASVKSFRHMENDEWDAVWDMLSQGSLSKADMDEEHHGVRYCICWLPNNGRSICNKLTFEVLLTYYVVVGIHYVYLLTMHACIYMYVLYVRMYVCMYVCMFSWRTALTVVVNISWEHGGRSLIPIASCAVAWIPARPFLSLCMSVCVADLIFSSFFSTGTWTYSTDKGGRERAIGPGGEASAGRSKYWSNRPGG